MADAQRMVDIWRGPFAESFHTGHAVVVNGSGEVVDGWGDPDAVILPRSSVKMIQALPLVASGAADAAGFGVDALALACASHQGQAMHTERVEALLSSMGYGEADLICGPHMPWDKPTAKTILCSGGKGCRLHNNCSGKHTGFLALRKHLGAGPDYVAEDHPVQVAVKDAFETVTGEATPGFGIDGCSAPNFATSMRGLGRAMAWFATAGAREDAMSRAGVRLHEAMRAHPLLVAGTGRACSELMDAAPGRAAIKTGAEGVFTAILPEQGLGVAVKISDGATRASECAVAALLVRLGVLEADHPAVKARHNPDLVNFAGLVTGEIRVAPGFPD